MCVYIYIYIHTHLHMSYTSTSRYTHVTTYNYSYLEKGDRGAARRREGRGAREGEGRAGKTGKARTESNRGRTDAGQEIENGRSARRYPRNSEDSHLNATKTCPNIRRCPLQSIPSQSVLCKSGGDRDVDNSIHGIESISHHIKTEIYDFDNELSTLMDNELLYTTQSPPQQKQETGRSRATCHAPARDALARDALAGDALASEVHK